MITKNRPDWQAGKLNGIGGKIEEGETELQAMVRECAEECGLQTDESDWKYFLKVEHLGNVIYFYSYIFEGDKSVFRQLTDEKIGWYQVKDLPDNTMLNLRWGIPLAIEAQLEYTLQVVEVAYI